jgi:hypothetical protein
MITVKRYSEEDKNKWNIFLENSRTNIFLFSRNYMDYHKDRFEDHSLLVFNDEILAAIFPASIRNGNINSHGGLTFGGLFVGCNEYAKNTLRYLSAILRFCHEAGIQKIIFKQSPSFYSLISQDETDYGMFLSEANMFRMDTAFAIDQRNSVKVPYQERRKRAVKKAVKGGIVIREAANFDAFWNRILIPNLLKRFGVKPVHTLEEITMLSVNNPGCIRQFEAWLDDTLMAGCTIFETPLVAHSQYISASEEGRMNGAIDLLFHHLITEVFHQKNYFDFGIANEEEGRSFNLGLLDWKEGFGARAFAHRFYEVDPSKYTLIDKALRITDVAENN